ncbi:GIN domain-containing protein [Microbacterium sp. SA39]|uniref:GIN domain-containing protein n=1 Tax=Microbacterium sp. SA39 TaxID=1263625 RepID=UPI0005F9DE33|nr:DUF2807 domain-containing protein [Microbacterium sp. SA39]KJQ54727.1 hypothetical protein RS85_01461 [Microbacterium sp. SA39]
MRSRLLFVSVITVVVIAASALTGCAAFGPGPAVSQDREVTDVTGVELDTSGDLTVTSGATPSLRVTAGERIIDSLTAEVDDGVLRLGMDGEPPLRSGDIRYELTVSSLESLAVFGSGDASVDFTGASAPTITIRGSGDVEARGIDASGAALTIDGSGEIAVRDAVLETLTVRIDGSGEVEIDGTTTTQRVEIGGAGGYDAEGLRSSDTSVTIRGPGSATVTAEKTLEAIIDGSADISYGGSARVTQEVSGSGDVARR